MFTRRIVILKRVKDLQLGVESYQKKLNITKPQTFKAGISKLTPYTAYNNPQGVIYQDQQKRNRLMRLDELYKFCDGTLTDVKTVLDDIAKNRRMEYLPKRDWCRLGRQRSHVMIKKIDELLFKRRVDLRDFQEEGHPNVLKQRVQRLRRVGSFEDGGEIVKSLELKGKKMYILAREQKSARPILDSVQSCHSNSGGHSEEIRDL
ncbi:hypothetical protein Tco_0970647 [Tanacetum coccineum]